MELIYRQSLTEQAHLDGVWALLRDNDTAFIPPLSHRESTCQKMLQEDGAPAAAPGGPVSYFEEMKRQSFLLAVEDGEVLGFFTFRENHLPPVLADLHEEDLLELYITTIIVSPAARRRGIASGFYALFMSLFSERRRLISTRTWSTNISHISLLEKLAFSGPLRIVDDRGKGIDTVYYHKILEAAK